MTREAKARVLADPSSPAVDDDEIDFLYNIHENAKVLVLAALYCRLVQRADRMAWRGFCYMQCHLVRSNQSSMHGNSCRQIKGRTLGLETQALAPEECEYRIASTGARVTLANAKSLLFYFCAQLPSDRWGARSAPKIPICLAFLRCCRPRWARTVMEKIVGARVWNPFESWNCASSQWCRYSILRPRFSTAEVGPEPGDCISLRGFKNQVRWC